MSKTRPRRIDPITTEVIRSSLIYASEEMGIAVRNAAYSPNIKERLDHSCALFDPTGRLIAQAEHIPVHLGSLPWGLRETLKSLAARGRTMAPGEMWVLNDPYVSGTHLNDVTVIRPIFVRNRKRDVHIGFAASKAHHTDVGGSVPGSMSPDAPELFAEGLIISPIRLMIGDQVNEEVVTLIRSNSRTPEARSGDLKAQIAGNVTGERRVLELIARYGIATFYAAIERILDESERRMRAVLRELGERDVSVEDVLEPPLDKLGTGSEGDELLRLRARVRTRDGTIDVDFAGTSPQVPFPVNAVLGVTLSGIHYVIRAATDPTIPMNEGCFRPVTVSVPEGTLLNPRRPAPVAGGNVETAQRICDVMLRAFAQLAPEKIPALSNGTMSNVMTGGETAAGTPWAFYETIGGGMGARPHADGIDGIHTHMTNTLNTPIEAMERYFPIRITRYEFAPGTGGDGTYRGGCGLVRAFELLEGTARVSLLAERHRVAPSGAQGGSDGAVGSHRLRSRIGEERTLPAKATLDVHPGDEVIVQTPGGGGYGDPALRDPAARERDRLNGLVSAPQTTRS
jgi:N-methylhydantoinase B